MIRIDDKLISEDLFTESFVCDLGACKGACCVEGDSGAPLEDGEVPILMRELPAIKPFMRQPGIDAIEAQGVAVRDNDGDLGTPLVNNRECAFAVFDKNGVAQCGIEKAWQAGKTNFRKPISCHLYPIRLEHLGENTALNYHQWHICTPACKLGASLKVKVFRFLREAIIRKFGEPFYHQLDICSRLLNKTNRS